MYVFIDLKSVHSQVLCLGENKEHLDGGARFFKEFSREEAGEKD